MDARVQEQMQARAIDIEDSPNSPREKEEVTKLYKAVIDKDWDKFTKCRRSITAPLSVDKDTALHMAVSDEKALQKLIEWAGTKAPPPPKNATGNTPLHAAASIGNVHAVKLLVNKWPELIRDKNGAGESPMFKAARYGNTEVLEFLFHEVRDKEPSLLKDHCYKKEDSILHAAIRGQQIGTALWIMNNIAPIIDPEKKLSDGKDKNGMTCLQLLATMPSVFEIGNPMNKLEKIVYKCIPTPGLDDDDDDSRGKGSYLYGGPWKIYSTFWNLFARGWEWIEEIREIKKKNRAAVKLVTLLAKLDDTWYSLSSHEEEMDSDDKDQKSQASSRSDTEEQNKQESSKDKVKTEGHKKQAISKKTNSDTEEPDVMVIQPVSPDLAPLLLAACNGITEIVEKILEEHPQAAEYVSKDGHNILHASIQHRHKDIYRFIRNAKTPTRRLGWKRDQDKNTILHHVSVTDHCREETKPNPVLHIQDEIRWYKRAEKNIPANYKTVPNKKGKTARKCFEETHRAQLESAREWCKKTCESCSTVAALVATIVFAAAFTVPGGYKENQGVPILLTSTFFKIFTIMDVVSLGTSLTSLVLFLSILTSPYKLDNFLISIPGRLMFGFSMLFVSVATTMIAFTATVLLTIHETKDSINIALYAIGFLPVSIFVALHFPLIAGFQITWKIVRKRLKLLFPRFNSSKKKQD